MDTNHTIDTLTGVYNRNSFITEIANVRSFEKYDEFAVISVNINDLRHFNDYYGLPNGDEIVVGAAECIKKTFSKAGRNSKIFRTGGDEFVIFLNCSDYSDVLNELEENIAKWRDTKGKTFSVSSGIVLRSEAPKLPLRKLARVSYGRMMSNKAEYYMQHKDDDLE